MAVSYISKEGLLKMQEELHRLETVERPKISAQIAEAREKGDLSENAEYDAAKEAQGLLEGEIALLKEKILNSKVIDMSKIGTDTVHILNKVEIKNTKTNAKMSYTIVSENEANLKEFKISTTTPIAQALLGKKVGDIVEVVTPAAKMSFEILSISI